MGKAKSKHASAPIYVSPNQLTIEGFQIPFDQQLAKDNRLINLDDRETVEQIRIQPILTPGERTEAG